MKTKICIVTATRAEYGVLSGLISKISESSKFELKLLVTGMHLAAEFGLTYKEILKDGFHIDEKVEILLSSDTDVGVAKSMGLANIGFADAFSRITPDLVIILGDRFEMLSAAQVALILKIPVAHIAGGDVTEGAYDDAIRHSITKMSNLHFVTNEISRQRVIQMGENPSAVFNVGSLGIDNIKHMNYMDKNILSKEIDFKFRKKNILITLHPTTNESSLASKDARTLLEALDEVKNLFDIGYIFTKSNADNGGREINSLFDEYCMQNENAKIYDSLGRVNYLNALQFVDLVVGNSSSGLYEVPSFNKFTINIGNRQRGRIKSSSIIDVEFNKTSIKDAIIKALNLKIETINPYGEGNTTMKIMEVLERVDFINNKTFYDLSDGVEDL